MNKQLGMLLMAGLLTFFLPAHAQEMGKSIELIPLTPPSATSEQVGPVYRVNASIDKLLPPEMYGTWSVTSTMLSGDLPPGMLRDTVYLIWTLETTANGAVILRNVQTGAVTQVHVDEVKNKTATFHHTATGGTGRTRVIEHITLTVDEDVVTGTEQAEYIVLRDGVPRKAYLLQMSLEGKRLSGAKTIFRPMARPENHFEIEPLQHE